MLVFFGAMIFFGVFSAVVSASQVFSSSYLPENYGFYYGGNIGRQTQFVEAKYSRVKTSGFLSDGRYQEKIVITRTKTSSVFARNYYGDSAEKNYFGNSYAPRFQQRSRYVFSY